MSERGSVMGSAPQAAELTVKTPRPDTPKPVLGTGQIYTDVLGVFVQRFPKILLLSMPAAVAMGLIFYAGIELLDGPLSRLWRYSAWLAVLAPMAMFALALGTGLGLASGPLSAALHEFKLHRKVPIGRCIARFAVRPVAAVICSVMAVGTTLMPLWLLAAADSVRVGLILGGCALAIGMYGLGFWGLAAPSVAIERLGLSALGRSRRLGEGYRWRIAGTCFLLFVTAVLVGGAVTVGLGFLFAFVFDEVLGMRFGHRTDDALLFLDFCLGQTLVVAVMGLGLAAIRARMVEIKEPPDIADMIEVFD